MTDIALDERALDAAAEIHRRSSPRYGAEEASRVIAARVIRAYLRASPSQVAPANPAQVTDAMVAAATKELLAHGEFSSIPGNNEPNARIAARAALAAAIGAGGQAVKALEWEEGNPFLWYAADLYRIEDNGTNWKEDRYWLFIVGERSKHPTLEAAKAAAQADYERRILSALAQPHPADGRVVEDERIRRGMEEILKEQSERDIPFAPVSAKEGR